MRKETDARACEGGELRVGELGGTAAARQGGEVGGSLSSTAEDPRLGLRVRHHGEDVVEACGAEGVGDEPRKTLNGLFGDIRGGGALQSGQVERGNGWKGKDGRNVREGRRHLVRRDAEAVGDGVTLYSFGLW